MAERKIGSEKIYDGVVVKLRKDKVVTERGVETYREIISHGGGACVLAVKDGKILLEKQYRYAYGEEIYEIPAGKRDKGEDFFVTAKRELEEETGLIPTNLKKITEIYPTPGYTDEVIGIFYADKFEDGKINFDDTEDLISEWVAIDEVYKMVEEGIIKDSKTLIALLWYKSGLKI
ncbi:MAG: NUDIX hydrolase [Clostridiales bacterium]|nr:NUDIX hydrolase [Clostridiales bacterium]